MVDTIQADKLNSPGVKALHGYVLLNTLNFIEENYAAVRTPYLLLHGEKDKICSVEGSKVLRTVYYCISLEWERGMLINFYFAAGVPQDVCQ